MRKIQSMISTSGAEFRRNDAHNRALVAEFREKQERRATPPAARPRPAGQAGQDAPARAHRKAARPRHALPRTVVARRQHGLWRRGAGRQLVVGIGIVSGREVMIRADDPRVKGGAWYPLTTKKIVRALDIAMENRLPVVHCAIQPAASCSCSPSSSPTAIWAAASSATSRSCRRWASSSWRWCSATAPPAAPTSRPVRLQRHRARHRRGVPRRPAAGEGGDRRGSHGRGARRRRHAHLRLGTADYPAASERRGHPSAARSSAQWDRPKKWDCQYETPEDPGLRPAEIYGIIPDDIKKSVRHARDHRPHRRRQPLPRIPAELRHDADLRLRQHLGLQGRHPRQQRRAVQRLVAEGRATSSSCATRTTRRWCSCRTSPAT
jgi:3-methylcrotonyl-CoA carboxylase beta subunit